ncbi:hypothetical protein KN815_18800 [Streptomyces sp. 4503]|uniref:Uncharacterized protein n=1 Tax=Streptomyces niphimycinicus TaxID=2842201 RepID=A0ABS6CGQ5_9ACTN|nr:hypothetical protein [Streptomyces niphimycinicus]MBU3866050.1 hypothetical protein [Streptomyces niphimycinicus]
MSEAKTYPSDPVQLPLKTDELEPAPVEGCPGCTELANVRDRARAGGDMTTVTDCNVYMRRHPEGHQ